MPYDFTSNPPHVPEGDVPLPDGWTRIPTNFSPRISEDDTPGRSALSDQVADLLAAVAALTARAETVERCALIALDEKVDAEDTDAETDKAYNQACDDIAAAIRAAAARQESEIA